MSSLIYFLVWGGLIFLMLRFGCGAHVMGHGRHGTGHGHEKAADDQLRWTPPDRDTDPVCGKTVRTADAKPSVYGGLVYYFCSRECRERFEAAPQLYVGPGAAGPSQQLDHAHG